MGAGDRVAVVGLGILAFLLAFVVFAMVRCGSEFGPMTAWCDERGGTIPSLYSNPMCITDDGLVLIPPKDANARWPE